LWGKIEPALFAMVPATRRRSHYCKSQVQNENMRNVVRAFQGASEYGARTLRYDDAGLRVLIHGKNRVNHETKGVFSRHMYGDDMGRLKANKGRYQSIRYTALNVHSYNVRGTLEFRLPPGTVRADKIQNWSYLFAHIVDAAYKAPERDIVGMRGRPKTLVRELVRPYPALATFVEDRWATYRDPDLDQELGG